MSNDIVGIDPGGEMSGVKFDPTDEGSGKLGSLLGGVGSLLGGPAGMAMMGAGGMPPLEIGTSSAESRATSGGDFISGDIQFGKSDTLVIAAVVVLGLLIVFGRK